jgi:hypothetical protein
MNVYKLQKVNIPDTWENVSEFLKWYLDNNMPMSLPDSQEVFLSDDATAICLFRHGQFQVEMYLIHPQPKVPVHEHPDVDVIKVRLRNNGEEVSAEYFGVLSKGQSHGAGFRLEAEEKGFPLLAVQHWKTPYKPTTVASRWKGKTVGPMQEDLIRRFNPNAFVINGYADVTQTMDYLKELQNVKSS